MIKKYTLRNVRYSSRGDYGGAIEAELESKPIFIDHQKPSAIADNVVYFSRDTLVTREYFDCPIPPLRHVWSYQEDRKPELIKWAFYSKRINAILIELRDREPGTVYQPGKLIADEIEIELNT